VSDRPTETRTRRAWLLATAPPPVASRLAARKDRPSPGWSAWLADPRSAVLFFLASAVVVGGGRKLLQGARARRAVEALNESSPTPEQVEAVAEHGRAGLIDLFRLMGTAEQPEVRDAAGRALARLWAGDELIVEEEKALVRRGFAVNWRARRRYPRVLRVPIPVEAHFGVPFLAEGVTGVSPSNLEWSHRVLGAERASLEEWSAWQSGTGSARFTVDPGDFPTPGPHRLALAARVRVIGLTDPWEIELPHIPFSFEFDPNLAVDALLTLPDDTRGAAFARSVGLEAPRIAEGAPRFLDLGESFVIRDPPELVVEAPLPCDLAHVLGVEIEDLPGQFRAGSVVVSGQGSASGSAGSTLRFPIGPIAGLPPGAIDRPGDRRLRAILTADPDLGWADPDVRSLWPGTLTTGWITARVIRR
jgi:hypothetical protein